jgi:hypothetical protein
MVAAVCKTKNLSADVIDSIIDMIHCHSTDISSLKMFSQISPYGSLVLSLRIVKIMQICSTSKKDHFVVCLLRKRISL